MNKKYDVAIVVFPLGKTLSNKNLIKTHISNTSYSELKKSMQDRYGINVFILDDENEIERLTGLIEDYFG